ncbi:MAG: hypothetical protein ACJAZO_003541 [Myxococcota bacterium]|jgi:hypothetical protein
MLALPSAVAVVASPAPAWLLVGGVDGPDGDPHLG